MIYVSPSDPFYSMINKSGYVFEHRLIMARKIGRCLKSWEVVHHKNGIKTDNRIENLELLNNQIDHLSSMGIQGYIKKLEKKLIILKEENRILKNEL